MCHVLIIEDEPMIAMDIQAMLEEQGATSFAIATTEAEAVEAARAHPPHLITSDVKLIEGTGPGAVQTILSELGQVPVMFITGTPEACDVCDPPAVVLPKPMRRVSVVETFKVLTRQ